MIMEELDMSKPRPNFRLTRYVDPYFGELMGNYVLGQIINIERGLYTCWEKQKMGKWCRPFFPNFRVLSDLTVGILGNGKLGSSVAKQLQSLECKVISYVRSPRNDYEKANNSDLMTTDLLCVFKTCDYICNVLPSTEETRGLLNRKVLKTCRKKPVFINIGRGDIIDEESIIEALNEGWISKAILDVFEEEPLPAFSPLWKHPQVIITPHIGAIPRIPGLARFIADNYMRFIGRNELVNEVDWDKKY